MKVIAIIGARPQFIKHFPFEKACRGKLDLITIHTGQHYDQNMSKVFFDQLGMQKPNYLLKIGSASHGEQTAKMMIEIERILLQEKPDGVVVYGDTNSTLAGALVASKLHVPVFHIEAGLRSFNKKMPEEINRVLTDHVSKALFVPSTVAIKNLKNEGIVDNVFEVGDIMKDVVLYSTENNLLKPIETNAFYYATIHRPYNTDKKERLVYVLESLNALDKKVIMPLHPRTKKNIKAFGLFQSTYENIDFIEPQSYFDNLSYLNSAQALLTDSGGMQKEAYWLQKKCITLRTETEWIETLDGGKNILCFDDLSVIQNQLKEQSDKWNPLLYGKGTAADLIVNVILSI